MKKSKIKVREGDVFAVPLLKGGYVIGLIAREHKGITLGYFFGTVYSSVPAIVDITGINNWEVVLIGKFSPLGIESGEWPLLKTALKFNQEDWPIPVFKMKHPITEKYFAVIYDETLINEERYLITQKDAEELFEHGLYGSVALQKQLDKILEDTK